MQFTLILQNVADDSIFLLFQSPELWRKFPNRGIGDCTKFHWGSFLIETNFHLKSFSGFQAIFSFGSFLVYNYSCHISKHFFQY
jgi:hypothetical protein